VITLQLQELDTEIVVATTSGTASNTTTVAANIVFDERQMNALFLDVVSYFRLNEPDRKYNSLCNVKSSNSHCLPPVFELIHVWSFATHKATISSAFFLFYKIR